MNPDRGGFSLLEIVLSLTIFFGSIAILSQMAWSGSRAVIQARLKTQAIIRCEAKLNEVLVGAEPLSARTDVAFPDNSQWKWSLAVSDGSFPDLLQIEVTAHHSSNNSLGNVSYTLKRWMRDPALFMDAAVQQKEEQEAANSASPEATQ